MINFPIYDIEIKKQEHGTGNLELYLNGERKNSTKIKNQELKAQNELRLVFTKDDPSDEASYATLDKFYVNGFDFTDHFKQLDHFVDQSKHKTTGKTIRNNCYFGYIGETVWSFSKNDEDTLGKAAWLIANNHFSKVRHPYKGNAYKERTYEEIEDQAKHMFAGLHPCVDDEITDRLKRLKLSQCLELVDTKKLRNKLIGWLTNSERIKIKGLENFKHMTLSNGVSDCLTSFISRHDNIGTLEKKYQFTGDVIKGMSKSSTDIRKSIQPFQKVLLEFPSVHYTNESLKNLIQSCHEKKCYIAIDLTFLPVSSEEIDIDLSMVDEFYFGLSKTWSLYSIRPGFRFSKNKINDNLSWLHDHNYFSTLGPNILQQLIEDFTIDHTYNKFSESASQIRDQFNLDKTSIIWAATGTSYENSIDTLGENWHLNRFISLHKLLEHKGKYFW